MQTGLFRLMIAAMLLLLLGAGCFGRVTSTDAEEQRDLPELVSLEQTESSFMAVVERGDAHVTIDVRRTGPRMPGFIRDPEIDSPYESDATLRNRHGYAFVQSYGGDVSADTDEANQSIDPENVVFEEQMEDLQLIADAAQMLRDDPDVGERFRWELREVYYMASRTRTEAIEVYENPPTPEPTPGIEDAAPKTTDGVVVPMSVNEEKGGSPLLSDSEGLVKPLRSVVVTSGSYYYHSASIRWANCC